MRWPKKKSLKAELMLHIGRKGPFFRFSKRCGIHKTTGKKKIPDSKKVKYKTASSHHYYKCITIIASTSASLMQKIIKSRAINMEQNTCDQQMPTRKLYCIVSYHVLLVLLHIQKQIRKYIIHTGRHTYLFSMTKVSNV